MPNIGLEDLSGIVEFSDGISAGLNKQENGEISAEVLKSLEENHFLEFDEAVKKFDLKNEFNVELQFYYYRALYKMKHEPMAFTGYLLSKLPFFLFFYIPIFTLLSWLFYIRRSFNYTDHLVFNYNLNTVFFIFLIFNIFIKSLFGELWTKYFMFLFFVYLFIAFKRFYRQGYIKTFVKLCLLSFLYNISSIIVILLMLAVSVLFF